VTDILPPEASRVSSDSADEGRLSTRKFRAFRDLPVPQRAALALPRSPPAALEPCARHLREAASARRATTGRGGPHRRLRAALPPARRDAALAAPPPRRAALGWAATSRRLAETPWGRGLHPKWLHRFLVERFGAGGAEDAMAFHDGPADQHLLVGASVDPAVA
jgi:hypothetical protein